jgi:threonine/homoserine/homoserine lactone efflux protein
LLTITPGLDTALVLRTAAVDGARRAMLAAAGICLGCLVWGLAVSLGLGELLSASHLAYTLVRIAGACYLIFLGVMLLVGSKSHSASTIARSDPRESSPGDNPGRWFLRGFLTNLLNPKIGVFYVSFLPMFIPANISVSRFSMLLAAIHAAEGLCWFAILVTATHSLSSWLQKPRVAKVLNRVTGIVFVGFGVRLLLEKSR